MTEKKAWDGMLKKLVEDKLIPSPLYRILLFGPPRTGKSSIGPALFGFHPERVTFHKQLPVEDLLGGYALVDGTTKWQDGPAIRALRNGKPLIIDEIDQFSPEVRCVLHALLDDPAGVTLASGERVAAKTGYCVIATTNQPPSVLPPAVLDRFDLTLCADTLSQGLKASLGNLANPAESVVGRDTSFNWCRPASVNLFIAASKLRKRGVADESIVTALGLEGKAASDALIAMRVNK